MMRKFERSFGVFLLMVLLAIIASDVRLAPPDGGPFLTRRSETSSPSERQRSPYLPVYHVPLRVHLDKSSRSVQAFIAILEEINQIWWTQAGICFEMQVVMNDSLLGSGIDIWFVPQINDNDSLNGIFSSKHSIYVRDTPILTPAASPARYAAARTAAHELGHALNLPHRQDSDDNLMRSKTYGWQLNREEIAVARSAAAARAIKNDGASSCSPVQVIP
jgi:hypothetical protein